MDTLPPPVPTVSIESAVTDHIDLFGEVEKVQKAVSALTGDISRLAGTRTADRGAIERIELRMTKLEAQNTQMFARVDTQSTLLLGLCEHLGFKPGAKRG